MEETRRELSKYRIEKAKDDLSVSKLNLENNKYFQLNVSHHLHIGDDKVVGSYTRSKEKILEIIRQELS